MLQGNYNVCASGGKNPHRADAELTRRERRERESVELSFKSLRFFASSLRVRAVQVFASAAPVAFVRAGRRLNQFSVFKRAV
jgi:hypothetical protein